MTDDDVHVRCVDVQRDDFTGRVAVDLDLTLLNLQDFLLESCLLTEYSKLRVVCQETLILTVLNHATAATKIPKNPHPVETANRTRTILTRAAVQMTTMVRIRKIHVAMLTPEISRPTNVVRVLRIEDNLSVVDIGDLDLRAHGTRITRECPAS